MEKNRTNTRRKDIVGTYERKKGADTFRYVLLDNGILKYYVNADKRNESKWSTVDKELQNKHTDRDYENRFIINPDNSMTIIAYISNGKRRNITKQQQYTYKKIK